MEKELAQEIHGEAIIVDGLVYGPAADDDEYFLKVRDAGITATNVTIPAVNDDFLKTREAFEHWQERIDCCRGFLTLAFTAADVRQAKKEGKTAIIMGTQNAVHHDDDFARLVELKKLGLRIVQLTYQEKNLYGAGCGVADDAGLTTRGKELVRALNNLGLLVDLSHCGGRTTMDALAVSKHPCVFSHANVRALCDHVRNKTDDQIRALAEKGGVMGIVSYSPFTDVRKDRQPTLNDFLDEIQYVAGLVGADHVGIGLDFTPTWTEDDYREAQEKYPEIYLDYPMREIPLRGLEDVGKVIDVTRGLLARGFSEADVKKILGGNFLRVFERTWR